MVKRALHDSCFVIQVSNQCRGSCICRAAHACSPQASSHMYALEIEGEEPEHLGAGNVWGSAQDRQGSGESGGHAARRGMLASSRHPVPPRWCRRAGAAFELLKGCTWIPSSTLYMHHLTSIHSLGCSGSYTNIRGRIQLQAHRKPSLAQPGRRGDEGGTGSRGVSRGWNSLQGAQPCPDTKASKQVKQLQKG